MRRKGKKRLPQRNPEPLSVPASINQCWSIDFMSDTLCGVAEVFRTFNVVDDYNREALAIEVDLKSARTKDYPGAGTHSGMAGLSGKDTYGQWSGINLGQDGRVGRRTWSRAGVYTARQADTELIR